MKTIEGSPSNKYLYLFLAISFGACYGVAILFLFFSDFIVPITGPLTLTHPLAILALYSPSFAGLITCYAMGGWPAVKGMFARLVPRRKDLFWIPLIVLIAALFASSMHFGSLLFGLAVPKITYSVPQMIGNGLLNLFKETGLIGGVFGWIGFLLPFLQGKFKNNITSSLLTGFLFGLWVLPGYLISSFGTTTTYFYYVVQLMAFVVFQSYIFNATRGTLLFYLLAFWLVATGSQIELYYFNPQVQIMQISFFVIAALIVHIVFKIRRVDNPLQTFPAYLG
ncbi:hypothetical protein QWJ34_12035 [Saccharibacillus sp. CPCC 101409]|uniref:hypothetical protein n=1 Tax=Saccharibacillus sp. CPCC 101409 TaxID=3058041 RepID=UPI00267114C6|nr:hypothetical protein [Saccharibacillus sp. CPCC 101409]MDO3410491.1 hypothetical protein [Saccharibacillus sp. CPCC 101409]